MGGVFVSVAAQMGAATIPVLVALWLAERWRTLIGVAMATVVVFAVYVVGHIVSTMIVTRTIDLAYAAKFAFNMFSVPTIPLVWVAFSIALCVGFFLRARRRPTSMGRT